MLRAKYEKICDANCMQRINKKIKSMRPFQMRDILSRTGRGIDISRICVLIPYGQNASPEDATKQRVRYAGLNHETGNAHHSEEDIRQEEEEPDGDRNNANLRSMNLAGHAQGVAYLVTYRRFEKRACKQTLSGKAWDRSGKGIPPRPNEMRVFTQVKPMEIKDLWFHMSGYPIETH